MGNIARTPFAKGAAGLRAATPTVKQRPSSPRPVPGVADITGFRTTETGEHTRGFTKTADKGTSSDEYLKDLEIGVKEGAIKPEALEAEKAKRKAAAEPIIAEKALAEEAVTKAAEISESQSAIFGTGSQKPKKRRSGSLITSGRTSGDATIGYGPVGNRKTLLGF